MDLLGWCNSVCRFLINTNDTAELLNSIFLC